MHLLLRRLSFSLLLAGRFFASTAQTAPAAAHPFNSAATLTRADTARAIHELFRSRRGGSVGWLAFGTAGVLASTLPAQQ
ncbi:MAG: hypothetical protein EOO62_40255, partial [Hymenobacter sp.]